MPWLLDYQRSDPQEEGRVPVPSLHMLVSYTLSIGRITRKIIVDNILSKCYASLLELNKNPYTLLSILYIMPSAVIKPVNECHN